MIALLGGLYGVLTAFLFSRFTNAAALRIGANRMLAHVLEFRLFIDEPQTIFKAQKELLVENLRVLRALALPLLFSGAVFLILYAPLNRYLGRTPLREGSQFVIATPMAPAGTVIETPGVRVARTQTEFRRVRVTTLNNELGHKQWLGWFLLFSTAGAALQTAFRISRVTPNSVNP